MIESVTLNNGVVMPSIGVGVLQSSPGDTVVAVDSALRAGYRLVDAAAVWMNERQVGEGLRASGVSRDEVFIATKVFATQYGYEKTLHAFDVATRKLGVTTIDVFMLHQSAPWMFDQTLEAYRALETLLGDGKIRAIGVSNFTGEHLDRLLNERTTVPAVNQIEFHPYFVQHEIMAANDALGIHTQAWSPLGGILSFAGFSGAAITSPLQDPAILDIAAAHDRTAAQVILRWHLQRGRSVIPKSIRLDRLNENLRVNDFSLTHEELALVDALDRGARGGPDPDVENPPELMIPIPEE
ncbi:aldo/keto reductase [Curtobacterium sp. MCLR17_045]|nr:aldo/keto reductase [Curtobacterium sp. MCLR17_045]